MNKENFARQIAVLAEKQLTTKKAAGTKTYNLLFLIVETKSFLRL